MPGMTRKSDAVPETQRGSAAADASVVAQLAALWSCHGLVPVSFEQCLQ